VKSSAARTGRRRAARSDRPIARSKPPEEGRESTPRVLRCLFEEHRHLAALVNVLGEKATQKHGLQAGEFYLLRDIVGYMHEYPDDVHHPTENRLFDLLLQRAPARKAEVDRLKREHQALGRETQGLLDLLDEAIERPSAGRESAVRKACAAFAVHQQAHMRFENLEMFPAAMESLTPEDFNQIESYFAAADDPLFGGLVGKRHRLLYEYMLNPAERASERLTGSRLLSLERLILTIDILEDGAGEWSRRVLDFGRELVEESRLAAHRALHPASRGLPLGSPVNFAVGVGRAMFDCGTDLLRIYTTTLRKGGKAFFR